MIHSKPKSGTLMSTGFFLLVILASAIWLLIDLIIEPSSYFIIKLVLIPVLLVIFIVVTIKTFFSAVNIQLGDNKLTYRYVLSGVKQCKVKEIVSWEEEVIQRKKTQFRQLTIVLPNDKKLRLSNHENSQYEQVINYLRKKVRKQT